jgi:D-tyrosyl-tRNA(Tyr) deacylase
MFFFVLPLTFCNFVGMRVVIQRVSHASVSIGGHLKSQIGQGLLVLLGVGSDDSQDDIDYLVKKTINLRIFNDDEGVMNRSVIDVGGDILVVSQFTLMASTKKGNRPSYIHAAPHEVSIPLYNRFCATLEASLGKSIGTGEFGADMQIELVNDGPVTICMDSKNKE